MPSKILSNRWLKYSYNNSHNSFLKGKIYLTIPSILRVLKLEATFVYPKKAAVAPRKVSRKESKDCFMENYIT